MRVVLLLLSLLVLVPAESLAASKVHSIEGNKVTVRGDAVVDITVDGHLLYEGQVPSSDAHHALNDYVFVENGADGAVRSYVVVRVETIKDRASVSGPPESIKGLVTADVVFFGPVSAVRAVHPAESDSRSVAAMKDLAAVGKSIKGKYAAVTCEARMGVDLYLRVFYGQACDGKCPDLASIAPDMFKATDRAISITGVDRSAAAHADMAPAGSGASSTVASASKALTSLPVPTSKLRFLGKTKNYINFKPGEPCGRYRRTAQVFGATNDEGLLDQILLYHYDKMFTSCYWTGILNRLPDPIETGEFASGGMTYKRVAYVKYALNSKWANWYAQKGATPADAYLTVAYGYIFREATAMIMAYGVPITLEQARGIHSNPDKRAILDQLYLEAEKHLPKLKELR